MEKLSLGGSGGPGGTGSQREVRSGLEGAAAVLSGFGGRGAGSVVQGSLHNSKGAPCFGVSPADFNRFPAGSG